MQCGTALTPRVGHVLYLRQLGIFASICLHPLFPQTGLFNRSLLQSLPIQQMFALLNLVEHSCLFLTVHTCILSRLANACVDRRATERERLNGTLVKSCPLSEAAGVAVISTHSQIVQRRLDQRHCEYVHRRFYSRKLKYFCLPARHDSKVFWLLQSLPNIFRVCSLQLCIRNIWLCQLQPK